MNMKNQLMIATLASGMALSGVSMSGCTTDPATGQQTMNKTAIGALAGAAAGAGISKATGGDETGRDAAIGAALGAGVGYYMQRQEQQLQQQMAGTGVTVERDPVTNNIDLVMPGNITFATDSTYINSSFNNTLDKLAATMRQYNQTTVNIMGHTDSTGNPAYNQDLSQRRAASVANYLVNQGVSANRIRTAGYGQTQPIASNNTEAGKAQNRRVEIQINAPQQVS